MIKLTNFIKQSIFILSVSGIVVIATPTTQAQPFNQSTNAPVYCSIYSNNNITNYASQHIDELGNMSPELKHRIFYAFDIIYRAGCLARCASISLDWFYLLEENTYYSKKFPSPWTSVLPDERNTTFFIYEAIAGSFSNTYFKEDLTFGDFIIELNALPNGDHIYGAYYDDTNDSGNGHGFVIYKTKHGRLGLLSTHVYPWDLIKLYRQDFLDQLFNSPEFRGEFFEDTSDLYDIQRRYKFTLIGINREVTEVPTDTPPPGNEGPEGESTDSPEGGE